MRNGYHRIPPAPVNSGVTNKNESVEVEIIRKTKLDELDNKRLGSEETKPTEKGMSTKQNTSPESRIRLISKGKTCSKLGKLDKKTLKGATGVEKGQLFQPFTNRVDFVQTNSVP